MKNEKTYKKCFLCEKKKRFGNLILCKDCQTFTTEYPFSRIKGNPLHQNRWKIEESLFIWIWKEK